MPKKSIKHIHVIPRNGSWVVRSERDTRPISTHETKKEAEEAARKMARNIKGELIIHNRDGRISSRDSYSPEPLPPKAPRQVLFPVLSTKADEQTIKEAVKEVIQESQAKPRNAS